ncbi:hypothetical protein GCM10011414_00730 [Croceivirga lutea]|uniref:DUF6326 family protein n=1 Tax=Croceivirga lutea TaxID=1775167 RepID=UPI00163A4948|nr:DUF6326 family protein [Croceivirga lutea]GGG35178.1 hypothetical protein GCM10011414_00730 [Croceivirga lutea]
MKNTKYLLSILWVFLTVNYIFCDVFSLYNSNFLNALLSGEVDDIEFTESFLLYFSFIMEIPMLMIILSVLMVDKINSITNISIGFLMLIIQIGSLSIGTNSLHYIFFSVIEIGTLFFIVHTAWNWYKHTVTTKKNYI